MSEQPAILVVDDDPVIRMFVCEALSSHGLNAVPASSADEGLDILCSRSDVSVVITDIVTPGTLDGLGLVSKIRRRWPRLRVIITSGRMPAVAAGNAEGTVFLAKPFDEIDLLGALAAVLASHA
jgi:DNA-binding NtrC family response regulator